MWLTRAGTDMLKTRPIVSVDRRGIGLSGALDCRDSFDRREMADQAQSEAGDDPVANLGEIVVTATTNCTDTISPGDSAYDNSHAAEDIERLRSTWDVPALAILGIGNGAQVALAYAGRHPDKVARLVLDSPIPPAINAEAAEEQQVQGEQAAPEAFAAQCAAANCPLGPDPKGAVDAIIVSARTGRGPGGASVAAVTSAISTALAFPGGDRAAATNSLAAALAAARSGDSNQLNNLINQAQSLRETDGQFVNRCSDSLNRPTPDRVRELLVEWGKVYPQFGAVGALDLVKCLNWPSGTAPPDPKNLKVNVLLMGGQNDPVVGSEGVAAVSATVLNAGVASKRVMWQGIGHGVSIYSSCALPPMVGYLDSGNLPSTDTYLPRLTRSTRDPPSASRWFPARSGTVRSWRSPTPSRTSSGPAPAPRPRRRCCARSCGRWRSCPSSTAAMCWPPTATSPTTTGRSTAPSPISGGVLTSTTNISTTSTRITSTRPAAHC